MTAPDGPCAISSTGLRVQAFDDGALAIMLTELKQALHLNPSQANAMRGFVRLFDQRQEPTTLLTEARDIIDGDREQTHGTPDRNIRAIAAIWTALLANVLQPGKTIGPELVCVLMTGLKLARASNKPSHREHALDAIGYLALMERCGLVDAAE